MTVKLSSIKADLSRETDGDWIPIPDLPGVRFKVRGFAYGPYQADRSIVEQRWARKYGRDPVPVEVSLKENGRLYAKHLLLGWEGFDEPYTSDLALDRMTDPAFRDLHEHLRYACGRLSTSQVEFTEDEVKNSDGPSAGN